MGRPRNPNKIGKLRQEWFDNDCAEARNTWLRMQRAHRRNTAEAMAAHCDYLGPIHRARSTFQATLPAEIKRAGTDKLWKFAHPQSKSTTCILPPNTHHAHCSTLFNLPAESPPVICEEVDPAKLPLSTSDVSHALEYGFRAAGSQGASPMPCQLLRHLSHVSHAVLAQLFQRVASEGVPAQWKRIQVTPVYKRKGDPRAAANYRTVAVAGPLPKLYMSCFNRSLTRQAEGKGWRADTQVGFRPKHRLEDLVLLVDYLIDRAKETKTPLAMAFIDLEKAFDRVPRARLFELLLQHYNIGKDTVESIRRIYDNLQGQVKGCQQTFNWTTGVKQGCPASPLLFGLFFDRIVPTVAQALPADTNPEDLIWITYLVVQAALYADDLLLLAASVPALQKMIKCLETFCND